LRFNPKRLIQKGLNIKIGLSASAVEDEIRGGVYATRDSAQPWFFLSL